MNIIDVLIILIIVAGGIFGFKKGFTRELVSFVGIFVVVILSFLLKNPVSTFLYEHLPFFNFGGIFKGITSLNIILYEVVALLIVMSILIAILRVITMVTNVFEKLLKFTIILGIPSKILGMFVGFIEGFVWAFIGLYILSLPVFNIKEIDESKYKNNILESTPILSTLADDTVKVIEEFTALKKEYDDTNIDSNEFNLKTLDVFLKYNVITVESVEKLQEKGKLEMNGLSELLKEYREDEQND